MAGHLGLHVRSLGLLAWIAAASAAATGCATASPRVKVLGVEPARQSQRSLLVFVEVVNPTQSDLNLSRLVYRVRAEQWFESRGQVQITRDVGAQSSAIIEIAVPVDHPAADDGTIPYTLEGKLYAHTDQIERSWDVKARGALGALTGGTNPVRVTVVDR